ncbi:hypothetical protein [Tersicoccus phoenicis]|nr:hypothetical protein [Tersicoccus phoenicis]
MAGRASGVHRNVGENTPVLDITVALGFRQVGVAGARQKRLT